MNEIFSFWMPTRAAVVFLSVLAVLSSASLAGRFVANRQGLSPSPVVKELNARVASWWAMTAVMLVVFALGRVGTVVLFAATSVAALREFMTQVYRYRADHNTIALCFYVLLPLQYYFVYIGWYSMFTVLIPVYAFLLLPIVGCMAGDRRAFFERTAKIQWGVMVTVYCLSHVPALMILNLRGFSENILLLLFLLVAVQGGDVAYYLWRRTGGMLGDRRTASGTLVSLLTAMLLATALFWITPFTPLQAALVGLVLGSIGFMGSEVMGAIKRSFGIRHWGRDLRRYNNVLDRVDGICFAAPVFFHIVRYYLM